MYWTCVLTARTAKGLEAPAQGLQRELRCWRWPPFRRVPQAVCTSDRLLGQQGCSDSSIHSHRQDTSCPELWYETLQRHKTDRASRPPSRRSPGSGADSCLSSVALSSPLVCTLGRLVLVGHGAAGGRHPKLSRWPPRVGEGTWVIWFSLDGGGRM